MHSTQDANTPLLQVEHLRIALDAHQLLVDDLSFDLQAGQTLAIVGKVALVNRLAVWLYWVYFQSSFKFRALHIFTVRIYLSSQLKRYSSFGAVKLP